MSLPAPSTWCQSGRRIIGWFLVSRPVLPGVDSWCLERGQEQPSLSDRVEESADGPQLTCYRWEEGLVEVVPFKCSCRDKPGWRAETISRGDYTFAVSKEIQTSLAGCSLWISDPHPVPHQQNEAPPHTINVLVHTAFQNPHLKAGR